MSNAFRLCRLDQITFETGPLPSHDSLHRIRDSSSTTLNTILSSEWEPPGHHLSYPIRTVNGFSLWTFFFNDSAINAQPFPNQGDPNRLTAIEALNGTLQLSYRRRVAEMQVPLVHIEFFLIDGDPGTLYAYADTNPNGSPSDPTFFLGDSDFSMKGVRASLIRQSNSLLLQTSLTSAPATSNVSTPHTSPSLSKMSRAPTVSPATRDTGPRTCSSSGLRQTSTAGNPSAMVPQQQKVRACVCKPAKVSKFVVERHPLADAITLPDVVSIQFGPKLSRFVPRRIQYGAVRTTTPTQPAAAGAEDAMDVDMQGQEAGDKDDDSYVTDTSSSDGQSSASMLLAAKTARNEGVVQPEPVDAQTLVLLQQHVHDPFFAAVLAQTWRQIGPESVPFPTFLSLLGSSSNRVRQLLLASSLLPNWRAVTNPLPVQQIRPDQVADLKESPTIDQVVVNDCDLLLGFDGDIRTLSAAAIDFWEESCLEPFKSKADVSYVVIPSHNVTVTEISMLIEPFFEAVSCMYETSMLGHHNPIKCFKDILSLSTQFQETIAASAKIDADLGQRYHEFILDTMNSSAIRSKLTSTDTSVVVIYVIVDGVLPTNPRQFASFINRLRLVLGAPTWNSASRRKNVVGQIVPLSLIHGLHVSNEMSSITTLRQLVFSVFSRNHFVPAIPIDSEFNPKLNAGLGLTAFEPAFVVHNEYGVPNPTQTLQRSRLVVHFTYTSIQTGDYNEWIVGCATDMRGERSHTACIQRIPGQPFSSALNSVWSECLRPILDFLHSRTDQGPMTVAVFKLGTISSEECSTWTSFLADRLGGDWTAFRERDLRSHSSATVENTGAASKADIRLTVSAVFLISCPSSAMLQLIEESNLQNNSFVLHQHQLLRDYRIDAPIVNADLYFRDGSSIRCQLVRYIVHGAIMPLSSVFVVDAFRAVIQQTLALNVFSAGPGTGLPLHIATTQRLSLSLFAVLRQANQTRSV